VKIPGGTRAEPRRALAARWVLFVAGSFLVALCLLLFE